ncbi:MAG TPA: hypothetical protein ENJ12_10240 [Thiolapillus brandeum]|uniref:Uncharacterized protein n=1 Tax=Thiolapillus brandeum TaxID=1076588 RepID=A0A831RZW8_9GAMM|nr:hypothetical protein [Thiolapillus brandeum]
MDYQPAQAFAQSVPHSNTGIKRILEYCYTQRCTDRRRQIPRHQPAACKTHELLIIQSLNRFRRILTTIEIHRNFRKIAALPAYYPQSYPQAKAEK